MKYKCEKCQHTGEQMNFLKARISNKQFRYETSCPSCGAGEEFVDSLEDEVLGADEKTDSEVRRIMEEAQNNFRSMNVSKDVLLTNEELEKLQD